MNSTKIFTFNSKKIIILSSSYGSDSTAHRILTNTPHTAFKITLLSPTDHVYWSIASSRGFIPANSPTSDFSKHITEGFKSYFATRFEFILLISAETLDFVVKKLGLSGNQTIDYDFLILITGV
jgi:NADH dehydrogenase FAD-containing subunit